MHTYAGYENKVKANLESRIKTMQMEGKIFRVHIPMEDVMEIKGGKKQIVQKKVFPGYLLVKMEYDNDSWYVVRNTPGVTGFVSAGTGQKPTPLSRREIEKILVVKKEEHKPAVRLGFEEGDVVRIIVGPLRRLQRHDLGDQRRPGQAQGAGQHLRPGDAGRAVLRPSGEGLTHPLRREARSTGRWNRRRRRENMAPKKKVLAVVTLQIKAAAATPAPPVGTALGQHGVNIMDFVNQYNAATQQYAGQVIPAVLTIYEDRTFSFILKQPPMAELIKQEAGIEKGSGVPNRDKVAMLSKDQLRRIAERKMPDLNANDVDMAMRIVAGTARSMGVDTEVDA